MILGRRWRAPAIVALFALATWRGVPETRWPTVEDVDADGVDPPTALLQSFMHVGREEPLATPHDDVAGPSSGALPAKVCTEFGTLVPAMSEWLVLSDTLQRFGYAKPCRGAAASSHGGESLLQEAASIQRRDHWTPATGEASQELSTLVPLGLGLIFAYMVGRMILHLVLLDARDMPRLPDKPRPGLKIRKPEGEAWQRGMLSWLYVDWVNEWVAHWGKFTQVTVKIKACELGQLGDDLDECAPSYERVSVLWQQEVDSVGLAKASLVTVLARFFGYRKVLTIAAWTAVYEALMYLGPPLAMTWTMQYLEQVYTARLKDGFVIGTQLIPGTFIAVLLFTGLPILMSISNTISIMMSARLGIRACGALSCLVFKKAQRAPLSSIRASDRAYDGWLPSLRAGEGRRDTQKHEETSFEAGRLSCSSAACNSEKVLMANQQHVPATLSEPTPSRPGIDFSAGGGVGRGSVGTKYNVVQLVENDIGTNLGQMPIVFTRAIVMLPIVAILFCMLFLRISCTIFLCLGASLVVTAFILYYAGAQIAYMFSFYAHAGKRLQFLEGILSRIRAIKAFGWEGTVEERIARLREAELSELDSFYWNLGCMHCWFYQFPRIMIFISLWGYEWLYGKKQPANIFATLPILYTFQSAVLQLMYTMPVLLAAKPSLERVELFLKQPEAPNGLPRAEFVPRWQSVWPRPDAEGAASAAAASSANLSVQGSFCWSPGEAPALRDLDLCFRKGSTVAIVGSVGSGKTALLHAMLGELCPVSDARLSVPYRIAYAAQDPHMCEGTLKENIINGESFNAPRYKACIHASGLHSDLEVLPSGAEVSVGSRGTLLSSGQRARVALARAAYCLGTELMLLDDPFCAVDARMVKHLLHHLIHGSQWAARTKVVTCPPDAECLQDFDTVVVMEEGSIVAQGPPKDVFETDAFRRLASVKQEQLPEQGTSGSICAHVTKTPSVSTRALRGLESAQLREDEAEGRADWDTISYICSLGGWYNLFGNVFGFLLMSVCNLMTGVVLQKWSTTMALVAAGVAKNNSAHIFLGPYVFWWCLCIFSWWLCWNRGTAFTLHLSQNASAESIKRLLRAPVDRFFDQTPVGRILNRMSTDLLNIDVYTYNQITMLIGHMWTNLVPLVYLHLLLPLYFSVACIPIYYLLYCLITCFWHTLVPMRYLSHVSKSHTSVILSEVNSCNAYVRASQTSAYKFLQFQAALSDQLKADIATATYLKRWFTMRLFLLLGCFISTVVIICMWVPDIMELGAVGLCLTNLFQILVDVEGFIDAAMQAQFQVISMNRLEDYTKLPQERDAELGTDELYKSYIATIPRETLSGVVIRQSDCGLVIIRKRVGGVGDQILLEQRCKRHAFVAPKGSSLQLLDETCPELALTTSWHCIVGVNSAHRNASQMAKELCHGTSAEVKLHIQSGWLADGARLCIEGLRAGYGDIPRDILSDVNLEVAPGSKVAIVGPTGCGKSTLLLCLLRVLEPRAGQVFINDVNIQTLGLATLRTAVGLVPQDPVLLQGSLRENIDPFGCFDDNVIWECLRMMQMEKVVKTLKGGLDFSFESEDGHLSFGQRQLLSLARVVIRQPALALLDEAISAMDTNTQELIQSSLDCALPDSTVIFVTHHLETILDFDMVVVMDQGKVSEGGHLKELAARKDSVFANMLSADKT